MLNEAQCPRAARSRSRMRKALAVIVAHPKLWKLGMLHAHYSQACSRQLRGQIQPDTGIEYTDHHASEVRTAVPQYLKAVKSNVRGFFLDAACRPNAPITDWNSIWPSVR